MSERSFGLWAWAMLLVVIASSLPGGRYQRTWTIGSPFDPANSLVVLSPRKTKFPLAPELQDRRSDRDTAANGHSSAMLDAHPHPAPLFVSEGNTSPPLFARMSAESAQRFFSAHAARGPPRLS